MLDSFKKVNYFIEEMNKMAKILRMVNTYYYNPHGLSQNKSTALD